MERKAKITREDILKAREGDTMKDKEDSPAHDEIKPDSLERGAPDQPTCLDCIKNKQLCTIHTPAIIVPTTDELNTMLPDLIDKAQYLALQGLIAKLTNVELLTPSNLTSIITQLQDIKLTSEWTTRLKDAIAKKARVMVPPGSRNSQLAKKLGSLAGHVQDAGKADHREGQEKLKRDLLLPPND